MRLFFGVELTEPVRKTLTGAQAALQKSGLEAGNWSRPELFHITLLFLGELDEKWKTPLTDLGYRIAATASPFRLEVAEPGLFERNRILWMGLKHDEGYRQLTELNRRLTTGVQEFLPISMDTRPYRAHLTLARKVNPSTYFAVRSFHVSDDAPPEATVLNVSRFCLFASTRIDGVLQYPVLNRFSFPDMRE